MSKLAMRQELYVHSTVDQNTQKAVGWVESNVFKNPSLVAVGGRWAYIRWSPEGWKMISRHIRTQNHISKRKTAHLKG